MDKPILHTDHLDCGYRSKKQESLILKDLSLALKPKTLTALLGANGAGKSTLIRTLAGVQTPLKGKVYLHQQAVHQLSGKEIARSLSLVLTENVSVGNLTVFALVSLGRFPYTSWIGKLKSADIEIIEKALSDVGMLSFAEKHLDQLSDGERQKVMIARALAQDTEVIFLDEPTAHLDLPNRVELMHLLRDLTSKQGKSILLSSHDLDSTLKLSDELWVIDQQRHIHHGTPEELVLNGTIEKAFGREGLDFDYELGSFIKSPAGTQNAVSLQGDAEVKKWLKNALYRAGMEVKENSPQLIQIKGNKERYTFQLNDSAEEIHTIQQLLQQLNTK